MEWDKKYLDQLIADQIEESGILEYKAAAALARSDTAKREITKDVSAFANASGGVIIYGIAECQETAKKHLPERYDPVDQRAFSREWVDQITGLIQPRIAGLKIVPIHVGPSLTDYCYSLDVPQSNTAHQALDLKYYKRRNFESTPMQDYEIRDVMNRRRNPQLEITVRLGPAIDTYWYLSVIAKNVSPVIARFVHVIVELPPLLNERVIFDPPGLIEKDGLQSYQIRLRNALNEPLFSGDTKTWAIKLKLSGGMGMPEELRGPPMRKNIYYRAFADQMPMIEQELDPREVVDFPVAEL